MSIATLKRKTQTQYNNMSVGEKNFSLNGTHRNQGFIGQTMLSRSLPRSLMNGNTLRGHGGCCGTYRIMPNIVSAVSTTEDSTIIKPSVMNNSGMLDTKYRWVNRGSSFSTVKPDSNNNINSNDQYVQILAKKTLAVLNNGPCMKTPSTIAILKKCNRKCYQQPHYTKPEESYVPISSGEYIRRIDNICTSNDTPFIQNGTQNIPLPGNGRHY
jgi:hypothetical protein